MMIHEIECENNERASFDDALSLLIDLHEREKKQKLNKKEET